MVLYGLFRYRVNHDEKKGKWFTLGYFKTTASNLDCCDDYLVIDSVTFSFFLLFLFQMGEIGAARASVTMPSTEPSTPQRQPPASVAPNQRARNWATLKSTFSAGPSSRPAAFWPKSSSLFSKFHLCSEIQSRKKFNEFPNENRFNLAPDAIHMGLPMIDTRHTAIDAYCPVRFQRPQCKVQRYRELDGMCNNLENPHWGAVMAPFRRLLPPNFQDGTCIPSIKSIW